MSVITPEIESKINALENGYMFNPYNYMNNIKFYENKNACQKEELEELEEFFNSDLFSISNGSVQKLVKVRITELETNITKNNIEIEKYFRWMMEYLK